MSGPDYHGWTHRRKRVKVNGDFVDDPYAGTDPIPGESIRNIKVFADRNATDGNLPDSVIVVSTGDGKFIFSIDEDEDGWRMHYVRAFVSVVGSGDVVVQIRNITQAHDFLTTKITIDTGDFTSLTSGTPAAINMANAVVADGDLVAIDVDSAGGGTAEGLGVNVGFRQT